MLQFYYYDCSRWSKVFEIKRLVFDISDVCIKKQCPPNSYRVTAPYQVPVWKKNQNFMGEK